MSDETQPQRTDDGHHVIVNGRRWRATDSSIPESLRAELVTELMSARRAVKTPDPDARTRVADAKVALGERGHPWWEEPTEATIASRAEATVRALLRKRDGSTICPSDVARVVGGRNWRHWMPTVRDVVGQLADAERIVVTQRGEPVALETARGPVRIARGARFDD